MSKIIEDYKERIVEELKDLNDKDTWHLECAEAVYYMVKTWKYLCEIEKMESMPPPSVK